MMCWLLSEGIFLLNYTWIDSEKPQMLSDKPFVLIAVMNWVIGQENMGYKYTWYTLNQLFYSFKQFILLVYVY